MWCTTGKTKANIMNNHKLYANRFPSDTIIHIDTQDLNAETGVKVTALNQEPTFRFNHPKHKKYYLARPHTAFTMWLYNTLTKNYNLPHDVTINIDEFNKILKQSWVKTEYIKPGLYSDYIVGHYLIDRKRAAKWVKQNINRITMNIRTKELIQTKNRNKAIEQAKQLTPRVPHSGYPVGELAVIGKLL